MKANFFDVEEDPVTKKFNIVLKINGSSRLVESLDTKNFREAINVAKKHAKARNKQIEEVTPRQKRRRS